MEKSFIRISCLEWASICVDYALFVMQDYLTSIWNLDVTHAAGILNISGGLSAVLPLPFLFLALNFLGNFTTLVISTFAYAVGIGFIALSTPPAFAEVSHTCETYQESCIGHTQKALFYTGMALIPVGVAAQSVSLKPFIDEQGGSSPRLRTIGFHFAVVIVSMAGGIGFPYVKPWSLRYAIPTFITFSATAIFLTGCCCCPYRRDGPVGNSTTAREEEVRIALRMIPIWLTLVICGTVSSTGNTYFVAQASNMNHHLGAWKLSSQILLLINKLAKNFFWSAIAKRFSRRKGVAAAMILSILCCIAAAKIEIMRLDVIRKHGLVDKPNDTIPMSVFWLFPQFILLAGLDTLLEKSIPAFYITRENQEFNYLGNATKAVTGLGFFGAVLAVYVIDTVTEKTGSKTSWFQPTLNRSRLDYYYWLLAILSTANLIVFVAVALTYKPETNRNEEADPVELINVVA